MPFSPKTLDFLFENHLQDSKPWFDEHKQQYCEYVLRPLEENDFAYPKGHALFQRQTFISGKYVACL